MWFPGLRDLIWGEKRVMLIHPEVRYRGVYLLPQPLFSPSNIGIFGILALFVCAIMWCTLQMRVSEQRVHAAVSTADTFPKTRGMLFIKSSKTVEISTWQSLSVPFWSSFSGWFEETLRVVVDDLTFALKLPGLWCLVRSIPCDSAAARPHKPGSLKKPPLCKLFLLLLRLFFLYQAWWIKNMFFTLTLLRNKTRFSSI